MLIQNIVYNYRLEYEIDDTKKKKEKENQCKRKRQDMKREIFLLIKF